MKNKKEVISYLVFGILTTLVNIISYGYLTKIGHIDYRLATTIAWFLSVVFAFVTNKLYVFNSKSFDIKTLTKEFFFFTFFRLLSYITDLVIMVLMVEWLLVDDLISKILANIIVVIFNYFASKFFIFKTST
jgi:putative flippase GtrA